MAWPRTGSASGSRKRYLAGSWRVAQHGPAALRRPGPRRERDEQRLLDGPERCLLALCHDRHYTAGGPAPEGRPVQLMSNSLPSGSCIATP
jgi:hypothetical protein